VRKRALTRWRCRIQIDHIRTWRGHDPSLPTEVEQCVGLVPCKYSREGWWIRGSSRSPPLRAGVEAEVEISLIVRKMASLSLCDPHVLEHFRCGPKRDSRSSHHLHRFDIRAPFLESREGHSHGVATPSMTCAQVFRIPL
jgi:hypothetical protein